MKSKVRLFGHALHPILVPFPIAFFTATFICAIVYASTSNIFWFKVEFVANCAGVAMAIVATLPGVIDWLSIRMGSAAKKTGLKHMSGNAVLTGLFGANAIVNYTYLHRANPPQESGIFLSLAGFLILLYSGYKGWSLVQTHHIGVDMDQSEEIPAQHKVEENAQEIFADTKEPIPDAKQQ